MSAARRLDVDDVLDLAWGQSPEPEEGATPIENLDRFCGELRRRIRKKWDNVIVVDGRTGVGKSSLGIQIAQGVEGAWDPSHTAYCAEDSFRLWRQLRQGQTLLYDESVLGLLSQGGRRNDELMQLVQAISIIRAKGITTVLCLPSIWMLDTFVREGLAEFWLNVYERGRARPHRAWDKARYRRPNRLPYDRMDEFAPIGFKNIDRTVLWKAYFARKTARIDEFLASRSTDPSGRMATCSSCGFVGNRHNVASHRCPGRPVGAGAPPSARTAERPSS